MNIGAIDGGVASQFLRSEGAAAREIAVQSSDLAVGQIVEVAIIDRTGSGRYSVRINGEAHSAESAATHQPGSSVLAVVTSVGDRLELRAISSTEDPAVAQTLATLAARLRIDLSAATQRLIVMAATNSAAKLATVRAGLFLVRLGEVVTPEALAALVVAQQASRQPISIGGEKPADGLPTLSTSGINGSMHTIGQLLDHVMPPPDGAASGTVGGSGSHSADSEGQQQSAGGDWSRHRENAEQSSGQPIANQLLSLSDGGAVQYRYVTLPLLVGGALIELDMALFQQRSPAPTPGAPRRLIMSLNTNQLGVVRIVAQSIGSRLTVSLTSTSDRGVALLSTASAVMRDRLSALGWNVDGLRCEWAADVTPAGSDIIDHVLSTGLLNRAI
jgi:hypothetical protein